MNKHEWIREWRRQRIERRELQSSRSDDADDEPKDLPWHDDPPGYDQFTDDGGVGSDALVLLGKAALLIVAMAIGVGVVWGFEVVLKGILILALVAVGLFVLFVVGCLIHGYLLRLFGFLEAPVESIRSWSGWPVVGILLLVIAALVVWIFWGWETILGIGIFVVLAFVILYSRPPWPF